MMWGRAFALVLAGALLAACQSAAPLRTVTQGEELISYSFTDPGTFEEGGYGDTSLLIRDGVYRIDVRLGNNELWWGQWGETYDDVIVQVETEQMTERNENAYGVMCRMLGTVGQPLAEETEAPEAEVTAEATEAASEDADATAEATADAEATEVVTSEADATEMPEATPEAAFGGGDGYLFLIQGTGAYGIFVARGRDLTPLVNWTTSDAINQGRERNVLRATCVGDYLAFTINDQLVAQVTDPTYRRGQVGMGAVAANRLGVRIEFDNLTVFAASTP